MKKQTPLEAYLGKIEWLVFNSIWACGSGDQELEDWYHRVEGRIRKRDGSSDTLNESADYLMEFLFAAQEIANEKVRDLP
jgi:hypothetical protein